MSLRTLLCGLLSVMIVTTVAAQELRDTIGPLEQEGKPDHARESDSPLLEMRIDPTGKVTEAMVLRSEPLLDQAALDAVKKWVYAPTCLYGAAIPTIVTVAMTFELP